MIPTTWNIVDIQFVNQERCIVNCIAGLEGDLNGKALVSFGLDIAYLVILVLVVIVGFKIFLERLAIYQDAYIDMAVRWHRKKTLTLSKVFVGCKNDERNATNSTSYHMNKQSSEN